MYTKLSVFDFDGTLIKSPEPTDKNKQMWADHYGKEEWPYIGWWGRGETLDMDVWDMSLIPDTIKAYREEMKNPNTMVIMLTGRLTKQGDLVRKILDKYGLKFDKYLFKRGGNTITDKLGQLNHILGTNTSIKEVVMWDDRDAHIPKFEEWGNNLDGIDFTIHHVPGYLEEHDDIK
jgi:hydroxymethylpyrimidine pyrophosphatase-like HAD family hydrolase